MDQVAIANLALGWLGAARITNFNDPSRPAQLIATNFEAIRDALLEDRDWSFATERMALQPDPVPPPFGFGARFQIPSRVLRVISADDGTGSLHWAREGQFIVTEPKLATLSVVAVVRVTDCALFSPAFAQALAARLASDLAVTITENRILQADLWRLYQAKLADATVNDGRQGRTQRPVGNYFLDRRR